MKDGLNVRRNSRRELQASTVLKLTLSRKCPLKLNRYSCSSFLRFLGAASVWGGEGVDDEFVCDVVVTPPDVVVIYAALFLSSSEVSSEDWGAGFLRFLGVTSFCGGEGVDEEFVCDVDVTPPDDAYADRF